MHVTLQSRDFQTDPTPTPEGHLCCRNKQPPDLHASIQSMFFLLVQNLMRSELLSWQLSFKPWLRDLPSFHLVMSFSILDPPLPPRGGELFLSPWAAFPYSSSLAAQQLPGLSRAGWLGEVTMYYWWPMLQEILPALVTLLEAALNLLQGLRSDIMVEKQWDNKKF